MSQVREFRLPDLGEGLTEAEIVGWLVAVGDVVAVDQPVVEVETAKARVEVPCPYGGVVTARFGEEGTELPVGAPLMTVAVGAPAAPGGPDGAPPATAEADTASGNVLVGYGTAPPATRRRRVGPRGLLNGAGGADGVGPGAWSGQRPDPERHDAFGRNGRPGPGNGAGPDAYGGAGRGAVPDGRGAGSGGRGPEADGHGPGADTAGQGGSGTGMDGRRPGSGRYGSGPDGRGAGSRGAGVVVDGRGAGPGHGARAGADVGPVPVVSPLVRRLARQHGLDLRQLDGSGREGLILRVDVERAIEQGAAGSATDGSAAAAGGAREGAAAVPEGAVRVPLRGVRGAVAEKLARSRREIPEATCWVDADATELLAARAAMNAAGGRKISVLALLARICTAALDRFPELNATVDQAAREIVRLPAVHLGFAAQTDRGLVVPVVRDAQARTAESLTEEFARLTALAREGALTPGDLTGGTFTLNNYGVFGVDGSTPIINHPEAAMLGVGRIAPKPWVHQGELAVRQVVQLSLTFDHRVCDGGVAGGFLRYVADCVERPAVLLRTL
ncbi:dihydrolipoamide acetyltransferase family protein [Streptomyces tremellae]|uniref:Dihydrolipoamide acetyltransferase component of pyruvate dehydrogenase complex n=1 Tax=Streptomyces tremellae TaxID=1124239 RepID=A0ABP7ESV7_9ACTN